MKIFNFYALCSTTLTKQKCIFEEEKFKMHEKSNETYLGNTGFAHSTRA